ncbi:CU044_5270 family protein [Streptomyces sp. NPDC002138]|uniref:CU044_5270 family protein n=1 Tax=Streptomyces sp. NPDC002138 TaxID=3154410 RepID=UPI0033315FC4
MNTTEDARPPGLSDAELPFHGHQRVREHLMRETAADALGTGHRSWSRRPLILLLAAGAATGAVTLAVTLGASGSGEGRPAPVRPDPAAVRLLDSAAMAAQAGPAAPVRDGQYLYTKTTGFSMSLTEIRSGEMEAARTDESAERWVSVDGSTGTVTRTAGGTSRDPAPGRRTATLHNPTYRFLESLPTDPDRLLETIYADTRLNHGPGSGSTTGPDQEAFVAIGDLLRTVAAPPGVSAALYRAAARIPGVVLVPGATDAAGREGVAVARVHNGERTEWIFDKDTTHLLGERTVLLKDSAWGTAGTTVSSTAMIARGVTDEAGRTPGQ